MKHLLRNIFALFFCFLYCNAAFSQTPPTIQWKRCFGGSNDDFGTVVRPTNDGGYIIAGYSSSNDGDVSANHGNIDIWLVKITSTGLISWKKCLGGTGYEYAYDIKQTTDNGFIIAGANSANGGYITDNHGLSDAWVIKVSDTGKIEWQKSIGGRMNDIAYSIQPITGGYIMAGSTSSDSINGSPIGYHSGAPYSSDVWVVKLDDTGNIIWQKAYGGTQTEAASGIIIAKEGGYTIAATTYSSDGDVSGFHGTVYNDIWILKIDDNGTLIWQKSFGGSSVDFSLNIVQSHDSSYSIIGTTGSSDGDITVTYGGWDLWMINISSKGKLNWQKSYGGSKDDEAYDIQTTNDNGYVIAGTTYSNDGMPGSGWLGFNDGWIIKTDSVGNLDWKKRVGGGDDDHLSSIRQTTDGGYITAGYTLSLNGDISGNHGGYDYWVLKLSSGTGIENNSFVLDNIIVYPTITRGCVYIDLPKELENAKLNVFNTVGQSISFIESKTGDSRTINLQNIPAGNYILQVTNGSQASNFKIVYQP